MPQAPADSERTPLTGHDYGSPIDSLVADFVQRFGYEPTREDGAWRTWLEITADSNLCSAFLTYQFLFATEDDPYSSESYNQALIAVDEQLSVYSPLASMGDGSSERVGELRAMQYGDYLSSPEWSKQRKWALDRAKGKCATCGSGRSLNVHHRDYANVGKEDREDLIVLCRPCHSAIHFHGGAHRPKSRPQ